MSDFDKEAEREKLRERFEQDSQDEMTERMGELLLQGATMTNTHCDDCGTPMFRHNGRSFCPHCAHEDTDQPASSTPSATEAPTQQPSDPDPAPQPTPSQPESATNAADALQAAIERHATAAAEAEDPRRASDHIAVAREAAETLAVLSD